MTNGFQVFIDSDAFVGRFYPRDPHHQQCERIFRELEAKQVSLATSSFVVVETATVLSHRDGQTTARIFLEVMGRGNTPVIHINKELQAEALSIFEKQAKKGTSVTDCANVAVMHHFQIPKIFSFDKVYPKNHNLEMVT